MLLAMIFGDDIGFSREQLLSLYGVPTPSLQDIATDCLDPLLKMPRERLCDLYRAPQRPQERPEYPLARHVPRVDARYRLYTPRRYCR